MLSKQFISDYKQLLTLFRKSDPKCKRFGAIGHKYKLHNPISETYLIQLSKNLKGYGLPRDYYDYLTKIANGGFSSSYGLFPIEKIITKVLHIKNNTSGEKPSDFLIIEHTGCANYILLKLTGDKAGTIAECYDLGSSEDIQVDETNLSFKLYLLDPFFKDKKFIKRLSSIDSGLYSRLMEYFDEYEKCRPRTDYEILSDLGLIK